MTDVLEIEALDVVAEAEAVHPMIAIEGLNASYGDTQVLHNVSLEIPERSITAFIGPSGCGKSTALRCINRMNDLIRSFRMSGRILLDGIDIRSPEVDVNELRKTVGMVFQHPNPFPMSIYDNIALPIREHERRISRSELDDRIEQVLRHACLWDEVKDSLARSALSLSGGQQQRLCIARALAVQPTVLMLDEPCASLDPISTASIEELLLTLRDEYTIVIVTHNLAQANRISDRCAFFLMGELIEYGPTARMFAAPEREETGRYISGVYG